MGIQKNAEFESKFCLQNKTCVLFSELAMNRPLALLGNKNMEIHVHKFEFSEKYFPLVPEVLLLAVFGNTTSVLSLGIKSLSFCLQKQLLPTEPFSCYFLLMALEEATLSPVRWRIFGKGRKEP